MDARVKPAHDSGVDLWLTLESGSHRARADYASHHTLDSNPQGPHPMKLVATVLGIALIIIAAIYFLMPADQLPSFFPGYEHGLARVRLKHSLVSGAAGIILLAVGWFMGRRS
jgi:hypothetical protein